MMHDDPIRGKVAITEPVICDLMQSAPMQRLKKIDQYGYRPLWVKSNSKTTPYESSRYVHSVGVYLLLLEHGAPLAEQIAGLIHDVSHAVFSHCADYMFGEENEKKQNFQDSIFDAFVRKSELPSILARHGFDIFSILDDGNFPLKERSLPDLCADRLAYSLQDACNFEEINVEQALAFLRHLRAENGVWFFDDYQAAKDYALLFQRMNSGYWAGFMAAAMLRTVGETLKYARSKNVLTEKDLFTTDDAVIEKIQIASARDPIMATHWKRMNSPQLFSENARKYTMHVFCKSRAVDPLIEMGGKRLRLSSIDLDWGVAVRDALVPREHFIHCAA